MLENGARYTYRMYTVPSGYTLVDRAAQASASVTCKVEAQGSLLANWASNDIKVEFKKYYGQKYIIVTHPYSYVYSYNPKLTLYYTEEGSSTIKSEVCNLKDSNKNTNSTRKNGEDGLAIDYYVVPAGREYTMYSLRVTKGIASSVYLSSVPSLLKDKETIGKFEDMVAANLPSVSSSSFEGLWLIDDETESDDIVYGLYINSGKGYSAIMQNGYCYYDDIEYFDSYTLQGSKVSFRDKLSVYSGSVIISEGGMIIISDNTIISFKKETGSYPISLQRVYSNVPGFWTDYNGNYYWITSDAWYEVQYLYDGTIDTYNYYYNDIDSDQHGTYSITSGRIEFFDEYGSTRTGELQLNGDNVTLVIDGKSLSKDTFSNAPNSLSNFFNSQITGFWSDYNENYYWITSDAWYEVQYLYDDSTYNYYYNDIDSDKHGTYSITSDRIEFFDEYGSTIKTGYLNLDRNNVTLTIDSESLSKNTSSSIPNSLSDFLKSKIVGFWNGYEDKNYWITSDAWYEVQLYDGISYYNDIEPNKHGTYSITSDRIEFFDEYGNTLQTGYLNLNGSNVSLVINGEPLSKQLGSVKNCRKLEI